MPDLNVIADILLRENLIDSEDRASRRFSISRSNRPLDFDYVLGVYKIRLHNAEDHSNDAFKAQLVRFVNDLEKHRGQQETVMLISVKGSKRKPFVFMDAEYSKVLCYIFVGE